MRAKLGHPPFVMRTADDEEEKPRGLLRIIKLGGTAGFLPEDVVEVLEGLFEHGVRLGERPS